MECVCCRCGALQSGASDTLCLKVPGAELSYHCHCFCCAQSPRMKCLYCNAWRDLDVWEAHGACRSGSMHLFVYSEPWPPFPDQPAHPPQRGMVITLGRSQEGRERETETIEEPEVRVEQETETENHVSLDIQENNQESEELLDIKPRLSSKAKWVSIGDIRKWNSCIRCGMVKIKKSGWIRHAQMCGQDSKYATRKFFIFLHTKAWCGSLVLDSFWDKHSDPETGSCNVCRISRKNRMPLPYQPHPPTRKNENALMKQYMSRVISKRKKRRESMAVDAQIRNASRKNTNLQIVNCTSLRPS